MKVEEGQALLRNSERKSFKRCRWKWHKNYVEGLSPRKKGKPLVFGSLVHDALEAWYPPGRERGEHPARAFERLFDEAEANEPKKFMYDSDGDSSEMRELGVAMLEGYVEEFGTDPHIEIIQPEQEFQLDIHDPTTGEYVVTAVGTMDALCFDHNLQKVGLLEHKTWKSVRTKHLQLDEQASTYWALVPLWLREQGFFSESQDIHFMMYNVLRKAMPDQRPRNEKGLYLNKDGSVSKNQPSPYFHREVIWRDVHDRRALIDRLIQEALEIRACQEGQLAVYKNPTYSCPYDCDFFDACELDETGSDIEEYLKMTTEPYDPYAAHESKAELYSRVEED